MTQTARKMNASLEGEAPSGEEISSANDVMLAMLRATKGLRIYLPNNPVLITFLTEVGAKMAAHTARFGDFPLDVEMFVLKYKGAALYENNDAKESLAFRIHADGVRALLFAQGVEAQEMAAFLEIVGGERSSFQDDDIATRLWERTLPHITYLLVEDFAEAGWHEEEAPITSQQNAISSIYATAAALTCHPPPKVPRHLLVMTSEEAIWLRQAKHDESHRNPLDDVMAILFSVLAGCKDPLVFKDYLGVTANLTANMFLAGEIGQVLRLVRFLAKLASYGGTPAEGRLLIALTIPGFLSEKTMSVLREALDAGESVTHEELQELLQIFGLPCLGAICELLAQVNRLKARKVIVEVLVELGRDNPSIFAHFLSDPRWYLVRNIVLVLSLMGGQAALEMIVGLINHREARIRREVLGFLERSPDPKAKTYILKFFRDESSALRIRALQILARERLTFALKPALALTAADDFKAKGIDEKKAVYGAIGEIGSERVIPLFRTMLLKKHWLTRSVEKESAICAVAGLMKMRNAAAVELLEEARLQRNLEVREIIEQAISVISSMHDKVTTDPLEA